MFLVALVAQLDRASVSEAEGYGFNSRRAHKLLQNRVAGVLFASAKSEFVFWVKQTAK